jgi:hypothetical protein
MKHWIERRKIIFCNRYADDIVLLYVNRTNANNTAKQLNSIHQNLQFKGTEEDNEQINYLDLAIKRNTNNLTIGIYRKLTYTDTIMHFTSNHTMQQKLAAYRYMLHRMYTLPITIWKDNRK